MNNYICLRINKLLVLFTTLFICGTSMAQIKTWTQVVQEVEPGIETMSPEILKNKLDRKENLLLIDVRTEEEFKSGHITRALWIPRGRLESGILQVTQDPQTEIIVYCGSGKRATIAAASLMNMGYKNVYNLTGGIKGWMNAGYMISNSLGKFRLAVE